MSTPQNVPAVDDAAANAPTVSAHAEVKDTSHSDVASRSSSGEFIPPPTFLPPNYEIGEVLGSGGMGVVFKALDRELNRYVAIKVIRPKPGTTVDEKSLARFTREAETVASLSHPNVIKIFAVVRHQESLAIVYQYLPKTLSQVMRDGGLTVGKSLNIAIALAKALSYIHTEDPETGNAETEKKSLVHRDVKPANILIDSSGNPILTDFGLVTSANNSESVITEDGQIVGTPAFMSPEQTVSAANASYSSDIYSLGVVLFEMLTGQKAFTGKSIMDTLALVRSGGIRDTIKTTVRKCPWLSSREKLIGLLQKSTALLPANRDISADSFADSLQSYLNSLTDEQKKLVICSTQIATDELTSRISSAITLIKESSAARWFVVALCFLVLGLSAWQFWPAQSNVTTKEQEAAPPTPVYPKEVLAPQEEKTEEAVTPWTFAKLRDELREKIPNFRDVDLIVDSEKQTLRLKLVDYDKKKVEAFLKRLSESKGTPPWQTADIRLAPDVERPKAFVEWAKAHNVFVY